MREELVEPLRRVLRWMLSLRDGEGRIVCPEHAVEHTGKSAYVIVLAAELAKHDPHAERSELVAVAAQQGRRLVANLVREGTSPCHTFRPGRHDPFNCSNGVIDGGACSDALAQLVQELGPELDPADREAFADASALHARTYLRYAVLDKGIPAQRAWGLTGLAGAWALVGEPELERAAVEAVGVLEGIQHDDGSYPYHPLEWGAAHPGASDVSAYYQSRVTAFLLFALERLGRDPTGALFRAPLVRGLDFLCALAGPDGRKVGLVEAKPWYWGAGYEVASHPFDVYALAEGWRRFGAPRYGSAALAAYSAWAEHLGPDGRPRSHEPGPGRGRSYQCPLFWASHAAWIARALPELEELSASAPECAEPRRDGESLEIGVSWFPNAQLGRVEDGHVIAWVRGARPPYNVHHGSPYGAGLVHAVRREGGEPLVTRCRLAGEQEGEWHGHRGLPSPLRGLRSGGKELRFSTWIARTHLRAGRRAAALRAPLEVLSRGVLAFGHSRVGSSFHVSPEVSVLADGLALRSGLAHRGGEPVPRTTIEREFRVDGRGLVVAERLLEGRGVRGLDYRVPRLATDVTRGRAEIRYRLA